MEIIKRTGIITISEDGVAQEIIFRFQGVKLNKVESIEIPLRYKPTHYVNQYRKLYSRGNQWESLK